MGREVIWKDSQRFILSIPVLDQIIDFAYTGEHPN